MTEIVTPVGGNDDGGKGKVPYPSGYIEGRTLEEQPTAFFEAKLPDGYQRALCTSFILDGKCKHGDQCVYAKYGGHPANPSKAMIEAVQERLKQWKARKGKSGGTGKSGGKGKWTEAQLKVFYDKPE